MISTLKHLYPPTSPSKNVSNLSQLDTHFTTPGTTTTTAATTTKRGTTVKLITTRPTIDPFAEIVTTFRPARTVKVLTRETFSTEHTTVSPVSLSATVETINYPNKSRTKSTTVTTTGQTGGSTTGGVNLTTNDSVNLFSVTETNEITDNEIALDSLDDTTTTEANCCNGNNNSYNSNSNNGNTGDFSFSGDKRNKNNNKTTTKTSVTFTNAHSHPMHNYSSTQMTIESTGETVDTDNSLLSTMVAPQSNIIVTPSTADTVKGNPLLTISSTTSQSNDTTINLAVSALTSPEKGSFEVTSVTTTAPTETGFITATATESTVAATTATSNPATTTTAATTTATASAPSSSSPTKVKNVTKNETKVSTDRPYVSHLGESLGNFI